MVEIDLLTIALWFLVFFAAGIPAGLMGFGFALVAVPILGLIAAPQLVVPVVVMTGTFSNLIVLINARKAVRLGEIWPMILGGILGVPFGTYLLDILSADTLRIIIGVSVLLFTLGAIQGFRKKIPHQKLAMVPVGITSGLLGGSIATTGPPVVLFLTNQGIEKHLFRANLIAFLFSTSLVTVTSLSVQGIITLSTIQLLIISAPGMAAGTLVGILLAGKVREVLFRRVALSIVAIAGILSIANGTHII